MKTTSDLMRRAMNNHGISWAELAEKTKELALLEIDRDISRFRDGEGVSMSIAAGIIALIVERK